MGAGGAVARGRHRSPRHVRRGQRARVRRRRGRRRGGGRGGGERAAGGASDGAVAGIFSGGVARAPRRRPRLVGPSGKRPAAVQRVGAEVGSMLFDGRSTSMTSYSSYSRSKPGSCRSLWCRRWAMLSSCRRAARTRCQPALVDQGGRRLCRAGARRAVLVAHVADPPRPSPPTCRRARRPHPLHAACLCAVDDAKRRDERERRAAKATAPAAAAPAVAPAAPGHRSGRRRGRRSGRRRG